MPTTIRTTCLFCDAPLTDATRCPRPSPHTRSGIVWRRLRWCQACDDGTAAVRAAALDRVAQRERHRAYMRDYNARPEVRERKRQHARRQAWRDGRTSFRCAACGGRWQRQKEARHVVNGRWERLGVCSGCRAAVVGPSKHDTAKAPRGGWAAYLRARRERQREARTAASRDKGTAAGKARAA